jgi:macrodomain Ter protein organizer (MatP/YcbG family)
MCYGLLVVKYRNGTSSDDKPITCKDEADMVTRLKEVQNRPEAVQVDVFIHNPHASIQLVQEWRARASVGKTEKPEVAA